MRLFHSLALLTLTGLAVMPPGSAGLQTEDINSAEFKTQELICRIGNNGPRGIHRSGYNGVYELRSIHQDESLFVPSFAGLNLEHIFDGSTRGINRDVFFEPRRAPMSFRKIDHKTALLSQSPTPVWQVESKTTFRLSEPYYIDVEFELIPRKDHFEGGALGVFWASYINRPEDKSIYFLRPGEEGQIWQQFCTQYHNHDSTVKFFKDPFNWTFHRDAPQALFKAISEVRYSAPFFYGRFRNMVFILIFDRAEGLRFAHSPSGGGSTDAGDDTNPAWDFQWVISDYKIGETHTLRYRVVYKQWVDRQDVLNEVESYKAASLEASD